MDLTARILELLAERGWSKYQLAKEEQLSQSTISSLIIRGNTPTISTIESCCKAFGITLAEFFNADLRDTEQTLEERRLICDWRNLTPEAKQVVLQMVAALQPSQNKGSKTKHG